MKAAKYTVIIGLGIIGFVIYAFLHPRQPEPVIVKDTPSSTQQEQKNNLQGTWQWVETRPAPDGEENPQPKSDKFSLRFSNELRVSGTTDCNNFMGSYSAEGDSLEFGPLASTLMFCLDSQESEFHQLLAATMSYSFDVDGSLLLILDQNKGTLVFAPIDEATSANEEGVTFTGTLEEVNTGCFFDAECYVVIDKKHVTAIRGWSTDTVGMIIGVDGFGDLESKKGEIVEVYARALDDGTYTLYGSEDYYIKTL